MTTRSIPVTEQLRSKRNRDFEVLSDALEDVTRDPELVSNLDAFDGTYLIFPLARHNFGIGARYFDSCEQATTVVIICNNTAEAFVGAD